MKRKICSLFLAVIMGLLVFSVSSFADGKTWLDIIFDFFNIADYYLEKENEYKGDMAYESNYCIRVRAEILEKFGDFRSSLPSDLTKEDFDQLLEWWSLGDNEAIEEKFGHSAATFCYSNRSDYLDFEKLYLMRFFRGRSDFVNQFFDRDLDNYSVDDNGNVQIPVEDLKTELEKQNQTLTPKNRDVVKYSWRDLSNGQTNYDANQLGRLIGKNHQFLDKASYADGVYIQYYGRVPGTAWQVPREGILDFYSPFQYHIYLDTITEDGYYDSTGAGYPHTKYEWHCDALYYLMIDGERSYTVDTVITTFEDTMSGDTYHNAYGDISYLNIGFMIGATTLYPMCLYFYDNSAMAHSGVSYNCVSQPDFNEAAYLQFNPRYFLYSDDVSKMLDASYLLGYSDKGSHIVCDFSTSDYYSTLSNFEKYHDDDIFDYGFYASADPFTTTYMFDITRLPSNSTVTISGDSVYDYSITDNSTGDTSTIYNYVTNNYAYPEKPDNNTSGSSGGSVGGNITVGGQVDVGGKVEIDVNINQQGGGVGTSYDMPDMSPINSYLNEALEESSGVRSFLSEFFSFLPPSILTLLGIGLTVVILSRILGR